MFRFLKNSVLLLAIISVLLTSTGIFGGAAAGSGLIGQELLEHAGLKQVWVQQLPLKKKETLEKLTIVDERVYALSSRNYMVSMNRQQGDVIFNKSFATVGLPIIGLDVYGDTLFSIVGNKLVEIDPDTGAEYKGQGITLGMTCPAARNNSFFYVGETDKRVHVLRADDKVQVFEVAPENESMITSILADEKFVVFSTSKGDVICIKANQATKVWTFKVSNTIIGPMVRSEDSLFFASEDTNVYRISGDSGQLIWKYQTEAILNQSPRVTDNVVYQYVHGKGLTAIDKATGAFMWQLPGGVDLLAESNGKAYVITKSGLLVIIDNEKKKKLYSVNFGHVSRYVTNVTDSKIYIADKTGMVACLKPVE